jgi:hypothetical protein
MNNSLSNIGRLVAFVSICAISIVVGKAAFESPGNSRDLAWQTSCKASLERAEMALTNQARPTQIAQRIRDLPSEYRSPSTRDVVRFLVSYWSAREDLQAAFTTDSGEFGMAAMVGWARDGVDSTALAFVPCADELAKLPGTPSVQSAVPEIVRWARGRVRWQAEVDDAAYVAADYIRNDPDLVLAARKKPSLAILAAASVPPEDPRYQSMWTYQSMFDMLLRANP